MKKFRIPIIKQVCEMFEKLYYYIQSIKNEEEYISDYESQSMKFIWGIKSWDDLSGKNCNLFTLNDMDLIYHKDTNDYSIDIETYYDFTSEDADKEYLLNILKAFTKWMNDNGYSTNEKCSFYKVFSNEININEHFDSIEECFAYFKILVNGYCYS